MRKPLGPPSGSPLHFQDVAGRVEEAQGFLDPGDLTSPFKELLLSSVIATASLPPIVILGGPGPIEGTLFLQQTVVVHRGSFAPTRLVREWRTRLPYPPDPIFRKMASPSSEWSISADPDPTGFQ